jgi:hypothetical protein
MSRRVRPFSEIRKWRAKDQHTGIGVLGGVPYTYRHLAGRIPPTSQAEVYRVETFIEFTAPTAIHGNVYYVPGQQIDAFFGLWGEDAETVIDIRPLTMNEALAEIQAFHESAQKIRTTDV